MEFDEKKEIKVTASDALEFEPVVHDSSSGRWTLRAFLLLVLFGVAVISWGLYGDEMIAQFSSNDGNVPLIKAPDGPIKVRPENPGGLKVPNQDKLVYDRIQNDSGVINNSERRIERLLPPPEQPIEKPSFRSAKKEQNSRSKETMGNGSKSKVKENLIIKDLKSYPVARVPTIKDVETAKQPAPPPPPQAPKTKSQQLISGSSFSEQVKSTPRVSASTLNSTKGTKSELKKSKNISKKSAIKNTSETQEQQFQVQLAATRSSKLAREEWERLKNRHLDLLGRLSLTINKVDLGSKKGIFHRLRAGPFSNETKARELCKALAKRKVGCLLIKPNN